MVRTKIQLPDRLYRDLKQLAKRQEWSLAETLRRAAEQLLERHPYIAQKDKHWHMPPARDLGRLGLNHTQVHTAALDDMEPRLPED